MVVLNHSYAENVSQFTSLNNKAQSSKLVALFMRKAVIKLRLIVESERIELSSKQVIKELSTRLVFSWFSIVSRLKTFYLQLSF